MRDLVILDVFGVLCKRVNRRVVYRPGVKSFLRWCYSRYRVGYYSSTRKESVMSTLCTILDKTLLEKTEFVCTREDCIADKEDKFTYHESWSIEEFNGQYVHEYSTVKIIDIPGSWLLCDDSPLKCRHNPRDRCIIVPAFQKPESTDEALKRLRASIVSGFMHMKSSEAGGLQIATST